MLGLSWAIVHARMLKAKLPCLPQTGRRSYFHGMWHVLKQLRPAQVPEAMLHTRPNPRFKPALMMMVMMMMMMAFLGMPISRA